MALREVDLMQAAARLSLGYHRTLDLILRGALRGERRNGRWRVDAADLERVARRREAQRSAAALGPDDRPAA